MIPTAAPRTLACAALFALVAACSTFTVTAFAQGKSAANETDAVNPYSPRYAHPHRHGAVPTIEQHEKMKEWAATHRPRHRGADVGKASTTVTGSGDHTLSRGAGADGIGVVSGKPKVYLVFWGSQWGRLTNGSGYISFNGDGSGYMTFSGDQYGAAPYMQKWIAGLGTNNERWSAVLTQYCDGPSVTSDATSCGLRGNHIPYPVDGGVLAGVYYDSSTPAPPAATESQIAETAIRAARSFGNTTAASNRNAQYIIMSPSGTSPDGFGPKGGFCAWHSARQSDYGWIAYTNMPYISDVGALCATPGADLTGYSLVGGHEYAETLTDMIPGTGWLNRTGSSSNGEENADECAWISQATVNFATGSFPMTGSWSNDTNRCETSHAIVTGPGGTPTASFEATVSGRAVQFSDTSTNPGSVISWHTWSFGDGTVAGTANPKHTYAAAGTYTVTETVQDLARSKQSTATRNVTVSDNVGPPTANFTYTVSGLTVSFTDTSTDAGGTLVKHVWDLGERVATSNGISVPQFSNEVNPRHTYATPGTYTVTQTVVNQVGASSARSMSVNVAASIVGNPGFEAASGASPWTMSAGTLCTNATCPEAGARSGTGFAWLNGYGNSHQDLVRQTIAIPSGKSSATLEFYVHIDSLEGRTTAYDLLNIWVLNGAGVSTRLATYSNKDAGPGWAVKRLNMSAFIGQTVTLQFFGTEDGSLSTSFMIDDVAVTTQ